ncbi:hypothetical protein quinque_014813 [Culex quinquefasciatus]
MEDNPLSEQLRIEAIKSMAQTLSIKRQIRANLTRTVNRRSVSRSRSVSFLRKCRYRGKMYASRFAKFAKNAFSSFELFYGSMKQIEGHFGSRISAYFKYCTRNGTGGACPNVTVRWTLTGLSRDVLTDFHYTNVFTGTLLLLGTRRSYSLCHVPHTIVMYAGHLRRRIASALAQLAARSSFIEASGAVHNVLTHKIFCSWDFGVANEKAAQLQHANIYQELREYLAAMNRAERASGRWQKLRSTALHATAHLIVLTLIAGVSFGLWMLLKQFGGTKHFDTWSALYVSIATNVTMLVFHYIFQFISKIEDYHRSSTALNINLLRNFLLQLCIVGVLMFYWLTRPYEGCWETAIGQEIYRLIVMIDFIVSVLFLTFLQGTRYAANRFYSRSISLPDKLWRSSQTQTLFLVLVFVSIFGVIITHAYIMTKVPVSDVCGPFRGNQYMYKLFMEGILKLRQEHIFWKIFVYVTKPAIIGGVLLTMGVITYYLRAKSKAQIAKVKLLKELLCMEAKDKEFLLANMSKITRGKEWNFDKDLLNGRKNSADKYYSDPSATWRYADSPRKISGNSVLHAGDEEGPTSSGYQRIDEFTEERVRMRRF